MEYIENATLLWKVIRNESDFIKLDPTRINIYPRPDVIMSVTYERWHIISPQYLISEYNNGRIYVIGPNRLVLTLSELAGRIGEFTSGAITTQFGNQSLNVTLDHLPMTIDWNGTISYNDGLTTQQIGYNDNGRFFKLELETDDYLYDFNIVPVDITTNSYRIIIETFENDFDLKYEFVYEQGFLINGSLYRQLGDDIADISFVINSDHTLVKFLTPRLTISYNEMIEHINTLDRINDLIDFLDDED